MVVYWENMEPHSPQLTMNLSVSVRRSYSGNNLYEALIYNVIIIYI